MESVYLIGIGGGSASYLVDLALNEGAEVSGSDAKSNEITDRLSAKGINVHIPHNSEFITGIISEVWYSAAITESAPGYVELVRAKELGIPTLTFAQAAARYFNRAEVRVAVAGTHGKSTTTAMMGWVLEKAGLSPTVALGAKVNAWNGNSRVGNPNLFVIEADEYARRFLEYRPTHTIILNVDHDHFDTYPTETEFIEAFHHLALNTEKLLVINSSEKNTKVVTEGCNAKIEDFLSESSGIRLKQPGLHNRMDAAAVMKVTLELGVSREVIEAALLSFPGVSRRFEHVGSIGIETEVYDDFGHHPTEIAATLEGARELYPDYQIILVHQPHQAGRLRNLMSETANALVKANKVILLPVYTVAGRESDEDIRMATSEVLAETVSGIGGDIVLAQNYDEAIMKVKELIKPKTIVITMGATDVWKVARGMI